jgi:hypothetical protein
LTGGPKKWFMLQMWRVQQIAAILSLVMLAITDALLIYDKMSWRSGIFETPYIGVTVLLLTIGLIIWGASILWDTRLRMWREQMTVLIERNPYAKEKMSSKEVVLYALTWLPIMDKMGKDDPEVRASAAALRKWIEEVTKTDKILENDIKDVIKLTGKDFLHPLNKIE